MKQKDSIIDLIQNADQLAYTALEGLKNKNVTPAIIAEKLNLVRKHLNKAFELMQLED